MSPGAEAGVRPAVWLKLAKRDSAWQKVAVVEFNDGVTQQEQDEFFEQLCLADAGDARYAALLGVKFFNGDRVKQNYEEAARWYTKAAQAGIAQAQFDLADCYLHGLGVPRSEREAIRWVRSAADLGFANAQANLGVWYMQGAHVKCDPEEGERLLRAAAAQKACNWEFAYDSLAAALVLHDDVASKEEALAYMTEAAEAGYVYSMERLCKVYELGWYDMGSYRNADLALVWARCGSEAGSALCRAVLADRYRRGVGVEKDEDESARLAQMSADSGCFLGYRVLAQLHEGRGELERALGLYRKASELGDEPSQRDAERLGALLA